MKPFLTLGFAVYDDFHGAYFTARSLHMHHIASMHRCEILIVDNHPDSEDGKHTKDIIGWMRTRERAAKILAPVLAENEDAIRQLMSHAGAEPGKLRSWVRRVAKDGGAKLLDEVWAGQVTPATLAADLGGDANRWATFANELRWNIMAARYVAAPEAVGTSQPRNRVFTEAAGDYVACMDSHVLLWPRSVERLIDYYERHRDTNDLLSGVLLYDDYLNYGSRFDDQWRDEMWGTWGADPLTLPHGPDFNPPEEPPFEIPAQGLGFFSCRKDAWLGFNDKFRGFGGEEHYIHEKFRQAGRKNLCLPWLLWGHRFGPEERPYPLATWHKIRNYVIGHAELGLPFNRLRRHFVEGLNDDGTPVRKNSAGQAFGSVPVAEWELLIADPHNPPEWPPQASGSRAGSCNTCQGGMDPKITLEDLYKTAAESPSDINEHCARLRELASQCDHVTAFGMRHDVSSVAILAGQPKRFACYDAENVGIAPELQKRQGACDFTFRRANSLSCEIDATDMLFLDTKHTAEHCYAELQRHAGKVRRWIVLHDTQIFGESGEDGGPGLLPALRRFLRERPEWSVFSHSPANNGLTVISCDPRDKKELPGKITMALNLARAVAAHVADGARKVSTEDFERRLEICTLCDQRADTRCTACGCHLNEKASWRSSECPLGKWGQVAEEPAREQAA